MAFDTARSVFSLRAKLFGKPSAEPHAAAAPLVLPVVSISTDVPPATPTAWSSPLSLPDASFLPNRDSVGERLSFGGTDALAIILPVWRRQMGEPAWPETSIVPLIKTASLDVLNAPNGALATTALHEACALGFTSLAHALLDRGVDPLALTEKGLSAIDLFALQGLERLKPSPMPGSSTMAMERPSREEVALAERLIQAGVSFNDELLPLIAAMPLGAVLEQRGLKGMVLVPPPASRMAKVRAT